MTPETALRPWIDGIETGHLDQLPRAPFPQVPDAATKLVVRVEEGGRRQVLVVGPRTRASYHTGERRASCVQVRLAPGTGRSLLGVPAVELVGQVAALERFTAENARLLARELRNLDLEETVGHLAAVLPARLADATDPARTALLRAGVDAMKVRAGHAPAQVGTVARELAVSERQLRILFAEGVGVSPKHYARIDRVHHVLAHAETEPWAELATATGYYDQSHMTTDFRALMGVPPRSFFTGLLPRATPCRTG
ncbi:helix-turn-helix domain-containing protein [Streptomyces cinnabarinus]|uniref:Helix-turn-helix domain-containing protein n=1 Tax=Streptomyces cinnabarinus TaxID=67287 RepID=A0ABY7KKD0_9ACTN|nr:helix-turn-helix domain-containing protein [Streptomyces cinnabarinus]WAZ25007.1 helix-turn-helix domain-containing protein [Streptomyces cinnabarinus]